MSVNASSPTRNETLAHVRSGENKCFLLAAVIAVAVAAQLVLAFWRSADVITAQFFFEQDLAVVGLAVLVYVLAQIWQPGGADAALALPAVRPVHVWGAMAGFLVLGALGHVFIMHGYHLSRDEQMVMFDAEVFAGGGLYASVPDAWRAMVNQLNTMFMIVTPGGQYWVSAYLPVNAMLHSLAMTLDLAVLVNPVLAAIGLFATWQVARHLRPDQPEVAAVACLVYVTSAQVWAASMTSYAMTGHLALNMIWLMCFLRGGLAGHAGAIATGFAATGLHQLVFHPLFALPFVMTLAVRRQWHTFAAYGVAYLAIGLFWAMYAKITVYAAAPGAVAELSGIDGYFGRLWALIESWSVSSVPLMTANLARFFAWQNLLLLPLVIMAVHVARSKRELLVWAMLAAMVLTPLAMLVLLAYQGHGWGYRYMHGLIGVAAILAGLGWQELRERGIAPRRALAVASVLAVLVAAPFLLLGAHRFVAPYAAADQAIRAVDADVVLVDNRSSTFALDLVVNRPGIENRPVRLIDSLVDQTALEALCAKYSVARLENIANGKPLTARVLCRPGR